MSLGEVALMRGDLPSARRYFGTVLHTHDGNALARFYVGYIALKGADTARARMEYVRGCTATGGRSARRR